MAIRQSEIALGLKVVPQAYTAGANATHLASFKIPTGMTVATGDIIELTALPADHRIVAAQIIPVGNFSTATADVGIMSGDVGDPSAARTSGNELFDDVALTAMSALTKADAILLEPSNLNRSIGVKFSAAVTGANQVIHLLLTLSQ